MTRLISPALAVALIPLLFLAAGCDEASTLPLPTMDHISPLVAEGVDREDPAVSDEDLAALVADHGSFALWMYHQGLATKSAGDNFLFSPLSISTAFSMLWPGGVGDTADEIAAMLHFGMAQEQFHPASNKLDRELASRNEHQPHEQEGEAPILEIVNDLWGLDQYPYVDEFLELLARHYGAGMWIVDFIEAAEAAREEINAYIAHQTRGLIEELLPEGSITSLTRLVLTNAIYFKGAWQWPFEDSRTSSAPFAALDGSTADVPMMSGRVAAWHGEVAGAEVVEIGYVGGDLSMVLILPDEGDFLGFEAAFDAGALSDVMDALSAHQKSGMLAMPRFEFEAELDLRDIFRGAGFEISFDPELADFRGLSEIALVEELHIGGAFHKAAIAVDEEGTEAAAATAIVVDGRVSEPVDEFDVRLDRPFMFVIRDRPTGSLLFLGRVVDAAAAQ